MSELSTRLELIPLPNGTEEQAWAWFASSPMRHVLHNEIVKKILSLRDKLEKSTPEEIVRLQSSISAHREFLGLIKRKDTLPTK